MATRYSPRTCTVEGCTRNDRVVHGMCGMHYQRMRKRGSTDRPTPEHCTIANCNGTHAARGLCEKHYSRLKRTGQPHVRNARTYDRGPENVAWVGDDVTYVGAHCRVKRLRGSARDHTCIDCGRPAADWSYDHADPNEKHCAQGPYSPDPDHYDPRCKRCHNRFDHGHHDHAQRSA